MQIDRDAFLASQGGACVVNRLSDEAKADALEEYMMHQLTAEGRIPRVADIEARIETRPYRRGVALSMLLALGAMGMTTLLPLLTGRAVNAIDDHDGGKALRLEELPGFLKELRAEAPVDLGKKPKYYPDWHRNRSRGFLPLWLVVFAVVLGAEWGLRRLWGLV